MKQNENPAVQILSAYAAAVYAKDVEAFVSLYDEDVCIFDMWGTWMHRGLQDWRKMAEDWFTSLGSERVVVDVEIVQAKQTPAMAFVSAFLKYTALTSEGETLRSLQNRITCVLEPRNGQWKIVHEQTSAPVDHDSLKVFLQRSPPNP